MSPDTTAFFGLDTLADLYERSKAGRTGRADRDFQTDFRAFLIQTQATDGDARARLAESLERAHSLGALHLDRHSRDASLILKIRIRSSHEPVLYRLLNRPTPNAQRTAIAQEFLAAQSLGVPVEWADRWITANQAWAQAATLGEPIAPFSKTDPAHNRELLQLIPRLLVWRNESLLRFASCVLCGHSKRLEALSPKLNTILSQVTLGQIQSLEDLGILPNPRFVLVHGPLQLHTGTHALDLSALRGAFRLSAEDVRLARTIHTAAPRCVIVENETTFHELAQLNSGTLLIQSSYLGNATRTLLKRLQGQTEFWHFGDSDPEGFDILRDARERTGLVIRPLHMVYRPHDPSPALSPEQQRTLQRLIADPLLVDLHPELHALQSSGCLGAYEQESLGRPTLPTWPFYPRKDDGTARSHTHATE